MRAPISHGIILAQLVAAQLVADVPDSPDIAIAKNGAHIPYAEMKPDDLGPKEVGERRPEKSGSTGCWSEGNQGITSSAAEPPVTLVPSMP